MNCPSYRFANFWLSPDSRSDPNDTCLSYSRGWLTAKHRAPLIAQTGRAPRPSHHRIDPHACLIPYPQAGLDYAEVIGCMRRLLAQDHAADPSQRLNTVQLASVELHGELVGNIGKQRRSK